MISRETVDMAKRGATIEWIVHENAHTRLRVHGMGVLVESLSVSRLYLTEEGAWSRRGSSPSSDG